MKRSARILARKRSKPSLWESWEGPLQIFELLKNGETLSKDYLAEELGDTTQQKSFVNLLGKMKGAKVGMVEYPDKNSVKMTDAWLVKFK